MLNLYSHLTAVSRQTFSLPVRSLMKKNLLQGRILDYGCGRGGDYRFLLDAGYNVDAYDPHFAPIMPSRLFDTIICIYVLNVLLPAERQAVLDDIKARLTPNGVAYFAVRRDIKNEGWRWHDAHRQTYQCNVVLDLPVVKQTHKFCIYKLSANT